MDVCDIPEAARLLNVERSEVRRMIETGALEAEQRNGRWRIDRLAVERTRVRMEHPGPQRLGDAHAPGFTEADVAARLDELEQRLARLEGTAQVRALR